MFSFPDLADDIGINDLQVPIETFGGKIIDGRRRFRACELAGVAPKFREVKPLDPVAYVLSLNLHRRHLNPSQLAMVGARARDIYDRQAKERQTRKPTKSVQVNLPEQIPAGQSRDLAGKAVGVSGKLVDYATKVIADAVPELVKAVDDGRVSVSNAALVQPARADRLNRVAPSLTACLAGITAGSTSDNQHRAGRLPGAPTSTVPMNDEERRERCKRRGLGGGKGDAPLPDAPTTAAPGTAEKVEVMHERAKLRRQLHHPADARFTGDARPVEWLARASLAG